MFGWINRIVVLSIVLAIAGAMYWAMRERPVAIDSAKIFRGPMSVTIDAEGMTRVRQIYTVSSPIAGHLDRTSLEVGQAVIAGETVVASIHPPDPPFIDDRTIKELEAAEEAARSAVALAEVDATRARMAFDLANSEYNRALTLAKKKVIAESALEQTYSTMKLKEAEVASSEAMIRLRQAELSSAVARSEQTSQSKPDMSDKACCVRLFSPVDGIVLNIVTKSEQAVAQGTPIIEIGNPFDLEIAVDLLSRDAPKLKIGSQVEISQWGGEKILNATIRNIEPAAFTKVSSLGIEEQRVNVILDLEEVPPELGNGYEVLARLTIWSGEDVLQVPLGALFRSGGKWAVFTVEDARAHLQHITLGQMNDSSAQVLEALVEGQDVILFPNDLLEDGSLVEERQ
jgi:HlyD family secretion protein